MRTVFKKFLIFLFTISLLSSSCSMRKNNLDEKTELPKPETTYNNVQEISELPKPEIINNSKTPNNKEVSAQGKVLCFERAQCFINPSGIIIVDDSWRYPEIEEQSEARSICRFESLGPSRKGVTRTDIHLY